MFDGTYFFTKVSFFYNQTLIIFANVIKKIYLFNNEYNNKNRFLFFGTKK